ncbi:tetratricopeptide repeat protein [Ekhidna sp.]|jgi:tetratricopeptide (TPR) repeat protein|uniref:tetratricopeptide repeat protein n=1 Tax=Ekhidna sp. TaxID=2608089 RepID=UPI0032EC3DBD
MENRSSSLTFILILCITVSGYSKDISVEFNSQLEAIHVIQDDQPEKALSTIDNLLNSENLNSKEKGLLFFTQGQILNRNLYNHDEAIISYYKALRYFREIDDIDNQSKTLGRLGRLYKDLFQYDYALEYYNSILDLPLQNPVKLLYAKYNIAKTYRLRGDYDEAISIQQEILKEFIERDLIVDIVDSHLEMGVSYIGLKNWEKATQHYKEVDNVLSKSSITQDRYKAKVLGSLGFITLKQKQYELAEKYLLQALPIMESLDDDQMLTIQYNSLGMLALETNQNERAIKYFQESLKLNPDKADKAELKNALNELIKIHKRSGNLDEALSYSEQLNDLTVPFIELSQNLDKLHKQYQAESAQYVIKQFELKESLIQAQMRNTIIGTILIAIFSISLVLFIGYKRRQKVDDSTIKALKAKYRELYLVYEKDNL